MRINFLQTLPNYSLIKLVCVLEVLIVIFLCLIYYGNLGEYLSRGPDKYGAISKTVVKNTNINSKIIQPISPKVSTLKGKTKKKDKKKKHKKKKMAFKPTIEQLRLYQNVSIPIKPKMECKSYHEQRGISHKQLWDWAPVRIFIGVWSTAGKYELRNFIRNLYLRQQRNVIGDKIDFKFIIGTPTNYTDELKLQLAAENTTHGDLIMLNIKENMDNGKAYHYWTWVWNSLNTMGYNYVAKADDDTFVHFQNLALNLRPLPRHYVYYGFVRPHLTRYLFVQGMIETLSIGHAKKIATTPYVKKEWDGPEDRMLATWLGDHVNSTLRVINEDCLLLNDPRIPSYYPVWRRWASPHSIAIHWLKEISAWKSVVDSYFPDK